MIARDKTKTPLLSRWDWTEQAIERVLRVPKGFMRDRTQTRIEELAAEQGASKITLEHVEAGIEIGLQLMKEMISGYGTQPASEEKPDAGKVEVAAEPEPAVCPMSAEEGGEMAASSPSNGSGNGHRRPLNEVSIMSELDKHRQGLTEN